MTYIIGVDERSVLLRSAQSHGPLDLTIFTGAKSLLKRPLDDGAC